MARVLEDLVALTSVGFPLVVVLMAQLDLMKWWLCW